MRFTAHNTVALLTLSIYQFYYLTECAIFIHGDPLEIKLLHGLYYPIPRAFATSTSLQLLYSGHQCGQAVA